MEKLSSDNLCLQFTLPHHTAREGTTCADVGPFHHLPRYNTPSNDEQGVSLCSRLGDTAACTRTMRKRAV